MRLDFLEVHDLYYTFCHRSTLQTEHPLVLLFRWIPFFLGTYASTSPWVYGKSGIFLKYCHTVELVLPSSTFARGTGSANLFPLLPSNNLKISPKKITLQGTNISHLGKRNIIFKMPFLGNMLVPWRVLITDSLRDHESLLGQGQVGQVSPFSRVLDEVFCCRFLSTGGGGWATQWRLLSVKALSS